MLKLVTLVIASLLVPNLLAAYPRSSVAMKEQNPIVAKTANGMELNHVSAASTLPSEGHPTCDAYFWVYFWDSQPNNQDCTDWKSKPGQWYFGKWYCFTGLEGVDKNPTRNLFSNIENAATNDGVFKAKDPSAELWVGGTVGGPFGDGKPWTRAGECAQGASLMSDGEDTIGCAMNKLSLGRKNALPYKLYYITPDKCSGLKPFFPNGRPGFSTKPTLTSNISMYGVLLGMVGFGGVGLAFWMSHTKQQREEFNQYEALETI